MIIQRNEKSYLISSSTCFMIKGMWVCKRLLTRISISTFNFTIEQERHPPHLPPYPTYFLLNTFHHNSARSCRDTMTTHYAIIPTRGLCFSPLLKQTVNAGFITQLTNAPQQPWNPYWMPKFCDILTTALDTWLHFDIPVSPSKSLSIYMCLYL